MEYTIHSRKLKKDITFFKLSFKETSHVWVDLNGKKGTLGKQICKGGYLQGTTLEASEHNFERICRKWLNDYYEHYFSRVRVGIRI